MLFNIAFQTCWCPIVPGDRERFPKKICNSSFLSFRTIPCACSHLWVLLLPLVQLQVGLHDEVLWLSSVALFWLPRQWALIHMEAALLSSKICHTCQNFLLKSARRFHAHKNLEWLG